MAEIILKSRNGKAILSCVRNYQGGGGGGRGLQILKFYKIGKIEPLPLHHNKKCDPPNARDQTNYDPPLCYL